MSILSKWDILRKTRLSELKDSSGDNKSFISIHHTLDSNGNSIIRIKKTIAKFTPKTISFSNRRITHSEFMIPTEGIFVYNWSKTTVYCLMEDEKFGIDFIKEVIKLQMKKEREKLLLEISKINHIDLNNSEIKVVNDD